MSSDVLQLEIVAPERELVREAVAEVQLPGRAGYLGILPGHTPLLTELGIGALTYRVGSEKVAVAVASGFAEVLPDRVIVLAEAAERSEEIDIERARRAFESAQNKLTTGASDPETDWESVKAALARARVRLEVATREGIPGVGARIPSTA